MQIKHKSIPVYSKSKIGGGALIMVNVPIKYFSKERQSKKNEG